MGSVAWRLKHLKPVIRAAATWRGERPRVYVHHEHAHPVFRTYVTHPPLRYAPYRRRALPLGQSAATPSLPPQASHPRDRASSFLVTEWQHFLRDWHRIYSEREEIERLLRRPECRRVMTFSGGLVEHLKTFVSPDLWPKLEYAYPAYPFQPEHEREAEAPFTVLTIASRFSDKGVPEALKAYGILRERHGEGVRMVLVSNVVPADYLLPEGVILYDTPEMTEALRHQVYRSADALLLPCYSETAMCFIEACAFGVPSVTTRIHHGDEFVRDGVTGFLLDAPLFIYSPDYGKRWKKRRRSSGWISRRCASGATWSRWWSRRSTVWMP